MKILHIVPTYYPAFRHGGPIESVHTLNAWLVKLGVEVTVYTTNINGDELLDVPLEVPVDRDGVSVFYFPVTFMRWEYSRALHKALATHTREFDLIHITSVFLFASTLGAYYARKFHKPYIISPRGTLMREPLARKNSLVKRLYLSLIERRNLAHANAIHFTAENERKEYVELGFPVREAIVIPNSFDSVSLDAGERGSFRRRHTIPEDKKIVLGLGRIDWKKGFDTLIPAFKEVNAKDPSTLLVIVGNDWNNYEKEVRCMVRESNLESSVLFTGMLTGKEKTSVFFDANCFVLASYAENFGMAVVEAMASGLPVVVTEDVGISPFVLEANAGLVVKKGTDEVARAIQEILYDPVRAKEMGRRGAELVKREFAPEKVAEKFKNAYTHVIHGETSY